MFKILKNNLKILKTIDIYMSMFTVGLTISLTGPALLDLQKMVNTDMQHIAFIYTSRSIGYLLGAILGGIVFDMVRSKLAVFTACNFFMAVTMFGIPWSRHVNTLLAFAVVNGLSLGALETGANVFCIELWGSGPFFQALQFMFGFGGLVSPLIAAPFLENESHSEDEPSNSTNFSKTSTEFSSPQLYNITPSPVFEGVAKITYPFSIVAIAASIATLLFLTTYLISPKENKVSTKNKDINGNRGYIVMFFIILFTFLTFFVCVGTQVGFGGALTTYAVRGRLHSTTTIGSYMTSAYWTSLTVMRLISIFLSIKVSNMILIISDVILVAFAGTILLVFMPSDWALWSASVIYGVGVASNYSCLIGWLNEHIEITNKISSIFLLGGATGEMVIPFVITYFIETIPEVFAYVTAASSVITTILFFMLYSVVKIGKTDTSKESVTAQTVEQGGTKE